MTFQRGLLMLPFMAALVFGGGCKKDERATSRKIDAIGAEVAAAANSPSSAPSSTNVSTDVNAPKSTLLASTEPAAKGPPLPSSGPVTKPATDPAKTPQSARLAGWYQWRGPEQNGVSREKNLPETWDPEKNVNVIWASDVGGMSSPVIWNGKLYTWTRVGEVEAGAADYPTLAPGPKTQEALTCVNIADGKVVWRHVNNMTQTEVPFHRLGWSSACVDPSTGRVYALGSQCWLLCLDGESGKVIWQRQMTEEFGLISTFGGRTPSPMIDEDQVFLCGVSFGWGDQARGQHRIYAFNKMTGELNWVQGTGGVPVDAPQNTPVIAVIKGQRWVLFAAGDGGIYAYQARTGKKVWGHKVSKRGLNTSVVVDGERLYCSHGLDNLDTNALGRVFCLDIGNAEKGDVKEVWHVAGIEAAFPTPCVAEKYMYLADDRARLYQIDKETGKVSWKKAMGRVGKPSPVFADGKLYVADGDGRFSIVKPGANEGATKILSRVDLPDKLGREYAIYGSPAICDGRIYLQTATKLYCIGDKDAKPDLGEIPPLPEEKAPDSKPSQLLVLPADVALHAGQSTTFRVAAFDANGRYLMDLPGNQVKWAIGQLTIPAPPPRPAMPKPESATPPADPGKPASPSATDAKPTDTPKTSGIEGAAAKGESPDAARAALAAVAATQPVTAPTKAGNLAGEIAVDGTFKSVAGPPQAGAIQVMAGDLTAETRVRVFGELPWKFDFEKAPVGKPPLTWLGAGGKYAVVEDPEDKNNKCVQKLNDIDLYYRARTNFGTPDMTDYTVQADAKVHEKIAAERRYVPTAAIINSRYVLVMDGMSQILQIHVWPSALPDARNPNGSQQKSMPFPFEAKKWYRLKLQVTKEGEEAVARGKAWPVGGEEPKDWSLELHDPIPNFQGNPGLFSVSLVGEFKSEVYYDNILVTPNHGKTSAAAGNAKQNDTATAETSGDLNK